MSTTDKMFFFGLIALVLSKQYLETDKAFDLVLALGWGLLACAAMVGVLVELIA